MSNIEAPFNCENGCEEFPDMEIIDQWSTDDINIIPRSFETSGYIALNNKTKEVFVVLRGTRSFKDSLIDISLDMMDYVVTPSDSTRKDSFGCELVTGGCKVHRGFHQAFRLTWERSLPTMDIIKDLLQKKGYKISILGHSLGGAVSVLLAISIIDKFGNDFDLSCVTMGQPMIGNKQFVEYVNRKFNLTQSEDAPYYESFQLGKIIRVSHLDDPIVKMPIDDHHLIGRENYVHFNNEVFINELGNQSPALNNVYYCQGNNDYKCAYGMKYSTSSYEHLNYFRRMGRCGFGYIHLPS